MIFPNQFSSKALINKGLTAYIGLFAEMGAKPLIRVAKKLTSERSMAKKA